MALIIGDIHGCLSHLTALLDYVQPTPEQTIVTLGDYIDRGEDTKGVIDHLLALQQSHSLITLKGNHDVFMEEARHSAAHLDFWLQPDVGGTESLASYGNTLDCIPESHWNFLANAPLYHEGSDWICVHGGLDATLPLEQQNAEVLLNKRFTTAEPHSSNKLVICGHTRQVDGIPKLRNNTLCIDTNVFDGG